MGKRRRLTKVPKVAPLAVAVALAACGPKAKPVPPQINNEEIPPQAPPTPPDAGPEVPPQVPPQEYINPPPVLPSDPYGEASPPALVGPFDRVS
jgi:hypothetical protein